MAQKAYQIVQWTSTCDDYSVTANAYFGITVGASYKYYYDTYIKGAGGLLASVYVASIYSTDVLAGAYIKPDILAFVYKYYKTQLKARGVEVEFKVYGKDGNDVKAETFLMRTDVHLGMTKVEPARVEVNGAVANADATHQQTTSSAVATGPDTGAAGPSGAGGTGGG